MAELRSHLTFVIKYPWWMQARLAALLALHKAGFVIDVAAEARAIVDASKIELVGEKRRGRSMDAGLRRHDSGEGGSE